MNKNRTYIRSITLSKKNYTDLAVLEFDKKTKSDAHNLLSALWVTGLRKMVLWISAMHTKLTLKTTPLMGCKPTEQMPKHLIPKNKMGQKYRQRP